MSDKKSHGLDSQHLNISSLLIANRGEISSRISRTCAALGIKSIAVFSDIDRDAPYVRDADMAIHIGESQPTLSYLDQDKIIAAAKRANADAIHPGYGFLAENAEFATRCEKENILWIGPHPDAIRQMGSKSNAKELMQKHGVPTVPGYQGTDQSVERLIEEAIDIGFPVLLKAVAGGGGKGMRIVKQKDELENAISSAKRESQSSFGNDELIIEKYIESGRHIEFQIFGDKHGHVIHVLERECTIQRRYQKVVEESPSPVMSTELRTRMGQAAINAAKALGYDNAGTVEFIYDDITGGFYFLEVNTRLQVEHPVTEQITGLDLVAMQIQSAQGIPLSINQEEIIGNGYAIELRLYAENPSNNFFPETGTISLFKLPEVNGLRVETAVQSGSTISIFYDPMIAKLIVHDKNRVSAIQKMAYVLEKLVCLGVTTNQHFLLTLMRNKAVLNGTYTTHFIQENLDSLIGKTEHSKATREALLAATLYSWNTRHANRTLLGGMPSGWRNSRYAMQSVDYKVGNDTINISYQKENESFIYNNSEETGQVKIQSVSQGSIAIEIDQIIKTFHISTDQNLHYIHHPEAGQIIGEEQDRFPVKEVEKTKGAYVTPMPSQIISIPIKVGDTVDTGDPLIVLSSMKMENTVVAEESGVVDSIFVEEGQNVDSGILLLKLKE